ncbi:aspartate aminotransferase, mitochondrial isoform X2 [Vigna radiata var. radiata]|uniref:aspartate transaminase n=1 Tax=Vigna radiata var. radiata TaxID=3916 RepID=A0A3Q0EPP4_VIGRR|nr:aspartate aminotransferase, mitochondrial isoform X2 [Vigna radiata var. radiata]
MWRHINGRISRRFLSTSARGWWNHVRPAPKDPIVTVNEAFQSDPSPHKINLGMGTYRGDDGKPFIPQSVRDAEIKIQRCKSDHHNIWRQAEIPVKTFHYYHPDTKGLNFSALLSDVKNAPDCSFFLLHPCAHNPTGVDPTEEQWREISYQFKVKNHFPFFDMAYQGFSSGDLDKDAVALRIFLEDGHLIGCSQSFSKNMGLSEHKVGCLSVLCQSTKQVAALKSQLQLMSHAMYSSIPFHGISLVAKILSDPDVEALWREEIKVMANRIETMRTTLRQYLEKLESSFNWEHITSQVGMFCFSGLTPDQVKQLEKLFHIYMTPDGRISMAGVTTSNVAYLANAIHQVTRIHEEALSSSYV